MLAGAALALKTRHAALEHAALQELPELALDEPWEAGSVAGLRRRAQEGFQVLGDALAAVARRAQLQIGGVHHHDHRQLHVHICVSVSRRPRK
jgi:hypothetical protein